MSGRYFLQLAGFGVGVGLSFAAIEYLLGGRKVVVKHQSNNTVNCSSYEENWNKCSMNYGADSETCKVVYSQYLQCINAKNKPNNY